MSPHEHKLWWQSTTNASYFSCTDPGIFVRGGPGQSDKKSSGNVIYRSQMVKFKENYHFSRLQRGSNIFQGGPTFSRGGPNAYSL